MNPDLEQMYVASYDTKGGFWTEPAQDFMRRALEDCVAGRPAERFAIAICGGLVEALRCVKATKAERKQRAESGESKEDGMQGGSTFTGGIR